jgi:hypothetical protein
MHDEQDAIIYVGKAISLKNRVRQYFQSKKNMDAKVRAMVGHIADFEYIVCGSEMEAFILENINYRSAPRDMWKDLRILKHFTENFKRTGNTTLTEREMQVLTISANNVHNGLERYWGHIKSDDEKALFHLMVTSMEIANMSTIIRPYELGELLEPETLKFGLDKMFTDCLY